MRLKMNDMRYSLLFLLASLTSCSELNNQTNTYRLLHSVRANGNMPFQREAVIDACLKSHNFHRDMTGKKVLFANNISIPVSTIKTSTSVVNEPTFETKMVRPKPINGIVMKDEIVTIQRDNYKTKEYRYKISGLCVGVEYITEL
jgi:hypothetical protein